MEEEEEQRTPPPFFGLTGPYKVKVPREKRQPILQELIECYQAKFGDEWSQSLTKNLRPSPIKDIAERHGVSPAAVRSLKHILWILGTLSTGGSIHIPPHDQ